MVFILHFSGRRGVSIAGAAAPGAGPLQNQLDDRAAAQGGQELRAGRLHIAIGAGHREFGAEQTLVLERRQHQQTHEAAADQKELGQRRAHHQQLFVHVTFVAATHA